MSDSGWYRRLYGRLWRHPGFFPLSPDEKLIALYVLTGPQTNRIGLFRFSIEIAVVDLRLSQLVLRRAIARICERFEWGFDVENCVIYVPSWWAWNPPANPNVLKGSLKDLDAIPPCELRERFLRHLETLPETLRQTVPETVVETVPRTVPRTVSANPSRNGSASVTEAGTGTATAPATGTTDAAPGEERRASPVPTRTAFDHYQTLFLSRYAAKPEYGSDSNSRNKHAGAMARLLRKHGIDEVIRRLDAYFDAPDPFLQQSGHSLGLFFSSDVQTKLVAHLSGRRGGTAVSTKTQLSLAARDRVLARIQEGGS
jgi:hypothetical protein